MAPVWQAGQKKQSIATRLHDKYPVESTYYQKTTSGLQALRGAIQQLYIFQGQGIHVLQTTGILKDGIYLDDSLWEDLQTLAAAS